MFPLENLLSTKAYLFLLVFARMSGILFFTPVIGGRSVPRRIRIGEAILFSWLAVLSCWYLTVPKPENTLTGLTAMAGEFLTGLAMGTGLLLFFSALAMAGDMIGRLGGFSVSASLDPAFGEEIPSTALLFRLGGIAIFLLAGGLDAFLVGVFDSLTQQPPGTIFIAQPMTEALVAILASSTALALSLAGPVILSALILWIVAGILARSFPRLNLMTFTFSGNTLLTLAIVSLSLGAILWAFQAKIPEILRTLFTF